MNGTEYLNNHKVALQISHITKRYGELTAVDNVSLTVVKNEVFGLLGPNGAGKTTLISMICGLLAPSEGKIEFAGYGVKLYKSLIGYCPQENIYYPKLSCKEQLIFMGQMYGMKTAGLKSRAMELLELLGLKEKADIKAAKLSGGMKRRLNICLALIHNPEILILDEPEAGLDPQSRILVRDFIKSLGKKMTVILTTHNMDEADRLSDRVAIIDHGKLLLLDTPQNLKKTIGEGDLVEIVTQNGNTAGLNNLAGKLTQLSMQVKTGQNSLFINHPNVIEHIPEIKQLAELSGLIISEVKLRENTLEDVFIYLTGRNLRQ